MIGKNNWVFCDGYLPPQGDNPDFEGHEALMLTNLNDAKAKIELVFVFEDKDPIGGIFCLFFRCRKAFPLQECKGNCLMNRCRTIFNAADKNFHASHSHLFHRLGNTAQLGH